MQVNNVSFTGLDKIHKVPVMGSRYAGDIAAEQVVDRLHEQNKAARIIGTQSYPYSFIATGNDTRTNLSSVDGLFKSQIVDQAVDITPNDDIFYADNPKLKLSDKFDTLIAGVGKMLTSINKDDNDILEDKYINTSTRRDYYKTMSH